MKMRETSRAIDKKLQDNNKLMAGYDVNEMMAAIEPNVKASIAFGSDMATTADLTTRIVGRAAQKYVVSKSSKIGKS